MALAGRFPGWSLTVCTPQIARLEQTWMTLRQRHTEGAILYEKKLKPFLKSLNEGKGTSPMLLCDPAQVSTLSGPGKTFPVWKMMRAWLSSVRAVLARTLHLATVPAHPGLALGARPRVQ